MKGAKLNMKEKEIYKVIKDFEQNKIPLKLAIRRSGVSERQLYRKLAIFRKEGIDGFAHKNRGKIPSNKITSLQKNEIKELYETKYYDNSILLFKENLKKNHGIDVSYGWLHKFFMDNLIITNLSHKKTKKRIKKLWWELKNHTNKEDLKIEEQNPELPSIDPHPHPAQKRAEGFGEVWEVDACQEIWLSNEKIHLHGIIDVSTKRIIAAYFDKQETNEAYFKVFRYAFEKYGLPELIISDNRNTFSSSKNRDYTTNSESRTQLQFIFHGLGITTKTTSISQEKPHIERLWRTLKNRWIPLLREWNISTIDEANLRINELINLYNEKFSTPINYTSSKITKYEADSEIIFSKRSIRIVSQDHTILYNGNKYFICEKFEPLYIMAKTKIMVMETVSGQLYCSHNNRIYFLRLTNDELLYHNKKTLPQDVFENTKVPKMPSPWHASNFIFFNKHSKLKRFL